MRTLRSIIEDHVYEKSLIRESRKYGFHFLTSEEAQRIREDQRPKINDLKKSLYEAEQRMDALQMEYAEIQPDSARSNEILEKDIPELQAVIDRIRSDLAVNQAELQRAENRATKEDLLADIKKKKRYPLIITGLYAICIIHIIISIVQYVMTIKHISASYIQTNPFYLVLWYVFPAVLFIWSTAFTDFNYENRRMLLLRLSVITPLLTTMNFALSLLYPLLAGLILKIPLTTAVTESVVVNVLRAALFIPTVVPALVALWIIFSLFNDPVINEFILDYRVTRGMDLRKGKQYKYDATVFRRMKDGAVVRIKEVDRFMHLMASGSTGTGKTSSVFITMIRDDLAKICMNLNEQKKRILSMLNKNLIVKTEDFKDEAFKVEYFAPNRNLPYEQYQEAEKMLSDLQKEIPIAGLLVCAPNGGFADQTYELCSAMGIKAYRVDPMRTASGDKKPGWTGFNPIAISKHITGARRSDEITIRSTIVKDILNSLNKASGSVDAYFEGVNSVQTTTVCKLLMLTYGLLNNGRQPTLIDVQDCLNDFSMLRKYYIALIENYGHNGQKWPENAQGLQELMGLKSKAGLDAEAFAKEVAKFVTKNTTHCGPWNDVYVTLRDVLLDPKAGPIIYDRAGGLRNQYNLFLSDERVRDIYSAQNPMDFDDVLLNGGVIILNYALELGAATSSAFGMFFLISYSKAVLRRDTTKFMVPFYTYIDEFPTILNRNLEELFTLHRQYRSANHIAIQVLDQLARNPETAFFKQIVLSNCAHKVLFGRVTGEEMKQYEEMFGMKYENMEQKSFYQTSMFSDNPSVSTSSRFTPQRVSRVEGTNLRYTRFQEAHLETVEDGELHPVFKVKTEFLETVERKSIPRIAVDWSRYAVVRRREEQAKNENENEDPTHFRRSAANVYIPEPAAAPAAAPLTFGAGPAAAPAAAPLTFGAGPAAAPVTPMQPTQPPVTPATPEGMPDPQPQQPGNYHGDPSAVPFAAR